MVETLCVVEQWLLWAARMEACEEWKQALEGLNEATRLVDNTDYFTSKRIGLGFAAVGCQLDKEGTASTSEIARVFEQSIIYCQRAIDQTPNGVDTSLTKNGLAAAHVGLGVATEEMGQYDRAIVARKRALRIWEELAKADPRHEAYRQEQASCSTALAELLCVSISCRRRSNTRKRAYCYMRNSKRNTRTKRSTLSSSLTHKV